MPLAPVLPASHRLTRGVDVRRVSRSGRRSGSDTLVVSLAMGTSGPERDGKPSDQAPRVGLVVGRSVGGAVVRHRVQRRLRHLCRDRLGALPAGSELVVRALGPSALASYRELGADLDRCLGRVVPDRAADRAGRPGLGR